MLPKACCVYVLALTATVLQVGEASFGQTRIPDANTIQLETPPPMDGAAATSSEKFDPALAEARSLLQKGMLSEADHAVREYLNGHANSADAHFLLGQILFREVEPGPFLQESAGAEDRAGSAHKRVREEKAKASLAEYTEGAKYRAPGAMDLKIVAFDYVLLHDYVDADKWLTRSLQRNPKDSDGWYYLGRTKYNENRFEEAISAFQQCLKLDPRNVKAEDNLGLSYAGLARVGEATVAYHTAITWQEKDLNQDAGPFIDLGALLLDQNRPQEAVSYLLQAVAISPRESRAHEQLGKAYEHLDQLTKAQGEFEKAVGLAPEDARLHYVLGQVYRKEGLSEKAKVEFDRSTTLRRDSPSEGRNP